MDNLNPETRDDQDELAAIASWLVSRERSRLWAVISDNASEEDRDNG